MLESVFITMIVLGFASFVLAIERDSQMYNGVSLLLWLIVLAGHVYVQVPNATYYYEISVFGLSLGMIMLNVIHLIIQFMVNKDRRRYIR